MQGAQKLRSEAHLHVRRNDEVAAQRRRWTFYETIKDEMLKLRPGGDRGDPSLRKAYDPSKVFSL
jgi:hypothetical protein